MYIMMKVLMYFSIPLSAIHQTLFRCWYGPISECPKLESPIYMYFYGY